MHPDCGLAVKLIADREREIGATDKNITKTQEYLFLNGFQPSCMDSGYLNKLTVANVQEPL